MKSDTSEIFSIVRGRTILGSIVLAFLAPIFMGNWLLPDLMDAEESPLADASIGLIAYTLLAAFIWRWCQNAHGAEKFSIGTRPNQSEFWLYSSLGIPLIGISILGVYVLYLPLSYVFPQFVVEWVLTDYPIVWWRNETNALLASGINVLVIAIIAPVIEEILFRGFLLNRWRQKYGVKRAILFSSLIFAFVHIDILGGIVFSTVLSLIYLKTQSLIGPILVHIANNSIAVVLVVVEGAMQGGLAESPLEEFQAYWWLAPAGAAVGIPWLTWFYLRSIR